MKLRNFLILPFLVPTFVSVAYAVPGAVDPDDLDVDKAFGSPVRSVNREAKDPWFDDDFAPAPSVADKKKDSTPKEPFDVEEWFEERKSKTEFDYSVGLDVFFGLPTEPFDGENDIELTGWNLRCAYLPKKVINYLEVFPEIYGLIGAASGDVRGEDGWGGGVDLSVSAFQFAAGINLHYVVNEYVSVFGGVRLGLGYMEISQDYFGYYYRDHHEEKEFGLLYGFGGGIEFSLTENIALNAKYECVDFNIRAQMYHMFSVGLGFYF